MAHTNIGKAANTILTATEVNCMVAVNGSGNAGIGTASPGADLPNGWAAGQLLEIKSDLTTTDAGLLLMRSDGATGSHIWHNGAGAGAWSLYVDNFFDNDAANIYFRTKTAGTPVDAVTILGSGNVGIGTSSPNTTGMLDAVGTNGKVFLGSNKTATTNKTAHLTAHQYDSAGESEGAAMMFANMGVGTNTLSIGGGTGISNAMTGINLYTSDGADVGDRTGVLRVSVTNAGNTGFGNSAPGAVVDIDNSTASTQLRVDRADTTVTNRIALFVSNHGGANTTNFQVMVDGDLENTNNAYGAISDEKLKENIVDATPKLADLMKVKIRNFNLKRNPEVKQIGVIAQELEKVFPKLVKDTPDEVKIFDKEWAPTEDQTEDDRPYTLEENGEVTKSVKYSVFVPMLIKAVQELSAEVELLKSKIP